MRAFSFVRVHLDVIVGVRAAALGFVLLAPVADGQQTLRVSVDSSGAQANSYSGYLPAISADGRFVAFTSYASNLVSGDTNVVADVFVRDRAAGTTERVSVDSSGVQGDADSSYPAISADGRFVAFHSYASNLVAGDANGFADVFVHDRMTGITERVSVDSSGAEGNNSSLFPAISADGRFVAFHGLASNLVAGDTNRSNDVFVHDRATGMTERVSVDSSGAEADFDSLYPSISADGRLVAFESYATNLVPGDSNGTWDVFVRDRTASTTARVSVDSSGAQANSYSFFPSISADGRFVAFASYASNLVAGDTNATYDVFVRDRSASSTERASVDSTGAQANSDSTHPTISGDGRFVAFYSSASNLVPGDTNGALDVFVRDRSASLTLRASVDSSGAQGNLGSTSPALSTDGQVVAFPSDATNLVAGDSNNVTDVFVHELCSIPASWTNYGAGYPGTNGVPSFTSRSNPVLGTTITLDLANSYGKPTAGLLFVGFQRAQIHSSWGGDLLVVPSLVLPISLPSSGASFSGSIPDDDQLCGLTIDLQALELDHGAAKGVSFTPGLELVLGH